MTAVVSKYYKGISAERRKKEFFKAVGFEPRQVNRSNIIRTSLKAVFFALFVALPLEIFGYIFTKSHQKTAKKYEL